MKKILDTSKGESLICTMIFGLFFYDFCTRFFMNYSLGFLGHDICTNFSYDFCSKTFLACIMHFKNQIVLFTLSFIFVAFMYFPLSDMCFEIQPKPERGKD